MAGRKTFLLGQAVTFADGVVGRLVGLEMEPDWMPTHLLVQAPGALALAGRAHPSAARPSRDRIPRRGDRPGHPLNEG